MCYCVRMTDLDLIKRLNRIDLNLLTVLHALLETGSTQGAADRMGRTQSAASHALKRLRETFSDPLFVRHGPKLTPTPLAEQLRQPISRLLADAVSLVDQGTAFDPASSERSIVIARADICNALSLRLYSAMMAVAPGLRVSMSGPISGVTRLVRGEVDVLISLYRRDFPNGVDTVALPNCDWATFVREGHPISDRPSAVEWASYGHVQVSTGPSPRNPIGDALRVEGLERRIDLRVAYFYEALSVAASTDIMFTSFSNLVGEDARRMGMRQITLPFDVPPAPMTLAVRARKHDALNSWLFETAQDALLRSARDMN